MAASISVSMEKIATTQSEIVLAATHYDLASTLDSGQAFRWRLNGDFWEGVVHRHTVRLRQTGDKIQAQTAAPVMDWNWLTHFLQLETHLPTVLATFPNDDPMNAAVASCRGLRLLRQDPWECLASFILSSTKQIVQIRQIVALLCERFGEPLATFTEGSTVFSFPTAGQIAAAGETALRECKMGFRARGLLAAARQIDSGDFDLEALRTMSYAEARECLTTLHGVGGKIADCVLLFAYGFDSAFPVDVWIERALQELYFPRRRANEKRLRKFAAAHFGPHSGYAQQYLFHYMRTQRK